MQCLFCGELQRNYRDIEVQTRTGWRLHTWCKQAIDLRRQRQSKTPIQDVWRSINFIPIYGIKMDNVIVYQ